MNLKKVVSLAMLMGGMTIYTTPSMVHAMEYEQTWMNSWGGNDEESATSVAQTSDGGFVAVGYSYSTNGGFTSQGGYDGIIVKYDSDGKQQWVKSWGGNYSDRFESVAPTFDGGFVVVGESYSNNAGVTNQGASDGVVIKYDSDGNQEWMKSWGGTNTEYLYSVAPSSDGGFIIVGSSASVNAGFGQRGIFDAIIIKYDPDGNQEWMNSWGGSGDELFRSVAPTSDGGFIVVGQSESTNAGFNNQGNYDGIIVKYDSLGNQEWMKSWGGDGDENFASVTPTSDGGFITVGFSSSTNAGFTNQGKDDAILIKYDSDGNQEWMTSWGGNDWDYFNSVTQVFDDGFLVAGNSWSTDAGFTSYGTSDVIVIKFDSDGNQEWIESWGGSGKEYARAATPTSDGGLTVFGESNSMDIGVTNHGKYDTFILKFSPKTDADIQINGNIQAMMADVTIPSVSPDLVIDPNSPDGAISPEFEITNDSTSPIKLDLKTFEQTTNTFNDVLPDRYDSWEGLNKTQSQDIALGLIAKDGDGWQRLTTPTSYVANHQAHEIGVIKPTSQVNFEFEVHHGRAFSESKTVQYKMVFVFDLLS